MNPEEYPIICRPADLSLGHMSYTTCPGIDGLTNSNDNLSTPSLTTYSATPNTIQADMMSPQSPLSRMPFNPHNQHALNPHPHHQGFHMVKDAYIDLRIPPPHPPPGDYSHMPIPQHQLAQNPHCGYVGPMGFQSMPMPSNQKPEFSYASLIAQSLRDAPTQRRTLNGIYEWILNHFPYYRDRQGWQNSIRHNLSLNKGFMKIKREDSQPGKGSFWTFTPGYENSLVNGHFKPNRSRAGKAALAAAAAKAKAKDAPDADQNDENQPLTPKTENSTKKSSKKKRPRAPTSSEDPKSTATAPSGSSKSALPRDSKPNITPKSAIPASARELAKWKIPLGVGSTINMKRSHSVPPKDQPSVSTLANSSSASVYCEKLSAGIPSSKKMRCESAGSFPAFLGGYPGFSYEMPIPMPITSEAQHLQGNPNTYQQQPKSRPTSSEESDPQAASSALSALPMAPFLQYPSQISPNATDITSPHQYVDPQDVLVSRKAAESNASALHINSYVDSQSAAGFVSPNDAGLPTGISHTGSYADHGDIFTNSVNDTISSYLQGQPSADSWGNIQPMYSGSDPSVESFMSMFTPGSQGQSGVSCVGGSAGGAYDETFRDGSGHFTVPNITTSSSGAERVEVSQIQIPSVAGSHAPSSSGGIIQPAVMTNMS
ncbi:Foxc1p [Mycoemilia scoparia]|uniref:Foxc1p n=1 Tax=Mycoemilia scoparia TaxID=417184 RepID=A0A9W8A0V0_9FUNG|nr:Foxc1p [Mycoemilia scoparia]